jgi:cyclopropane fatty-acyl-phospholipid synthase-like methyltransferase
MFILNETQTKSATTAPTKTNVIPGEDTRSLRTYFFETTTCTRTGTRSLLHGIVHAHTSDTSGIQNSDFSKQCIWHYCYVETFNESFPECSCNDWFLTIYGL